MMGSANQGSTIQLSDATALVRHIAEVVDAFRDPTQVNAAIAEIDNAIARDNESKSALLAATLESKNAQADADARIDAARQIELDTAERKAAIDKEAAKQAELARTNQLSLKERERAIAERNDALEAKVRDFEARKRESESAVANRESAVSKREESVKAREDALMEANIKLADKQAQVASLESELNAKLKKLRDLAG